MILASGAWEKAGRLPDQPGELPAAQPPTTGEAAANPLDNLLAVQEDLVRCMKCGNCQAVCPVYGAEKAESLVARGRLQLVAAWLGGRLQPSARLAERLDECTLCLACAETCPTGVDTGRIFLAARAEMARRRGLHPVKRVIFRYFLNRPAVFRVAARAGAYLQGLALQRTGPEGAHFRYPFFFDRQRLLPTFSRRPLLSRYPEVVPAEPVPEAAGVHGRVAYFVGCGTNYIYPDMGEAVVEVLQANGVEVVIPQAQACCGMPVLGSGDVETARQLARRNLDIFWPLLTEGRVDALITACSSCGGAWVREIPQLLEGDPQGYGQKARQVAEKVHDISEYLVNHVGIHGHLGSVEAAVTYHDPCHLNRAMGVRREPREVLRAVPGLKLREMKRPERCCGNAGSFSLTHYSLSKKILSRKIEDIAGTGADWVATGCPGCRMQIADGLSQYNMPVQVRHPVQFLAQAYRNAQGRPSRD